MTIVVRIWILLSTVLVSAGWILSVLHQLNRGGYAIVFLLLAIAAIYWWKKNKISPETFGRTVRKFRKRFKRAAPFLFLLLAMLTFAGGSLYPVLNPEANTYRLPRVCHWLAANQWHWIHTPDLRMNIAACGYEWLVTPLILLNGSDRLVFLVTWLPFLMLPGLIFSVFTRLQVRPRTAWWWMWFLSSGWCFVLEAGSGTNDSFATVYALAAVDLALRTRKSGKISDLWLSLLAAALATGVKQTSVPLAALWIVAAWPVLYLLRPKLISTAAVAATAILISVIPISIINYTHYGTWLPLKSLKNSAFGAHGHYELNPFLGIIGNSFCIPVANLWPPFSEFLPPYYGDNILEWNYWMTQFNASNFGQHFASFENFGYLNMNIDKDPGEGTAGIGLSICILTLAAFYQKRLLRRQSPSEPPRMLLVKILHWLPWTLLLIFMAKVGTYENARQLASYYIFLFPLLLAGAGHESVSRQRQWQMVGIGTMIVAALMVVTLPARPLFPAETILTALSSRFPDSKIIQVQCDRYFETFYRKVERRRIRLESALPSQEKIIGYCPGLRVHPGDELSIWFHDNQQARWVIPEESLEQLRQLQIHYLVTDDSFLAEHQLTLADWIKRYHAVLVREFDDSSIPVSHALPTVVMKSYVVLIDQAGS